MTKFLMVMALLVFAARPAQSSIYIAAHADDIALFMALNAWTDLQEGDRSVFILTTASDDGHGDYLPNTVGKSLYKARQEGHERAIRFWLGSGGTPVGNTVTSHVILNGKSVEHTVIDNRIFLYQFHLPDGGYTGNGYASTGNRSLAKLLSGAIPTISAVTSANPTNYSLAELQGAIRAIVLQHGHGASSVWVNMLDENLNRNPGDHSDHNATGRLMASVLASAPLHCANVARYTSYSNASKPVNMSAHSSTYHSATWGVVNSGLVDGGNKSTWDSEHNGWLGRQYFLAQAGNGTCNF
jgi:hypothetical protein